MFITDVDTSRYQLLTKAELPLLHDTVMDLVWHREELGTKDIDYALETKKGFPKNQKCKYCKKPATKRIIHSEGMAYVPVCDDHLSKGKDAAARCTPDGSVDPSNIDGIRDVKVVGGPHDTSPVGHGGDNWVTRVGGLPKYVREIAHALIRSGHSESSAIRLAIGTIKRWARGGGNVTAQTKAKAAAALAELVRKGAQSRIATAARRTSRAGKGKKNDPTCKNVSDEKSTKTAIKGNEMTLEHKSVPVNGVTVVNEDEGIVETFVSVTGMVDKVKDNIEPGCYEKSLASRTPKGIWSHDWNIPVSKTLAIKELLPGSDELPKTLRNGDPWPAGVGALKVQTQFNLKTTRGRDAFEDVKFYGADQEWSIGYNVPDGGATFDSKTGVRHIKAIDLYEYSPVLFGAMPQAVTQSVKTAQEAWKKGVEAGIFVNDFGKTETKDDRPNDDTDQQTAEAKKEYNKKQRESMAKMGTALDDGSFPIADADDLKTAIQAWGLAKDKNKAKEFIVKRAHALNLTGELPEGWGKDDTGNKALDTASAETAPYLDTTDDADDEFTYDGPITLSADDLSSLVELIAQVQDIIDRSTTGNGSVTSAKDDKPGKETKDEPNNNPDDDTEPTSMSDAIGDLSKYKDTVTNFDKLSSLAGQFDKLIESNDRTAALDIGREFLNELQAAVDDSTSEEAQNIIAQIAGNYGSVLNSIEKNNIDNNGADSETESGDKNSGDDSENGSTDSAADAGGESKSLPFNMDDLESQLRSLRV